QAPRSLRSGSWIRSPGHYDLRRLGEVCAGRQLEDDGLRSPGSNGQHGTLPRFDLELTNGAGHHLEGDAHRPPGSLARLEDNTSRAARALQIDDERIAHPVLRERGRGSAITRFIELVDLRWWRRGLVMPRPV